MSRTKLAEARRRAGVSQAEAAVRAKVSPPTARLFEVAGPTAIADERKRKALESVYAAFGDQPASPRVA